MSFSERTRADISYRKIEDEDDVSIIKYRYVGPPASDPVIRPFCESLMERCKQGETFTRAQIDQMDNHQIPNVLISGGGFNCRHQFVVAEVIT